MFYQFKRTAIHNILVTSSIWNPKEDVNEGLVIPEKLMQLGDIAPYERILVTRHGGDNWHNRMCSFAIPGKSEVVEARGALAHLLKKDEYCCIIAGTYLNSDQYEAYCRGTLNNPLIDIRFAPVQASRLNNFSTLKMILEYPGKSSPYTELDNKVIDQRKQLPRIMLSNLASGLEVAEIERHCLEMSAELPVEIMKNAGMVKNQSIFVFNASRGGISAESYVVPNTRNNKVIISGALSRVADIGDIISEASFVITTAIYKPTLFNINSP
jgi:aspartate 1-decarboxylase